MLIVFFFTTVLLALGITAVLVQLQNNTNRLGPRKTSAVTGLLAATTLENYEAGLKEEHSKQPSPAQRRGSITSHLRSIYKKRQEFEKKRKYLTLIQSLVMAIILLRLFHVQLPFRFMGINLNPTDLDSRSQTFLLVVIALLAPLTAKAAFIEFFFARVYHQMVRDHFRGPKNLISAIYLTSGHEILWKATRVARDNNSHSMTIRLVAIPAIYLICIYDYLVEFFPFFAAITILLRQKYIYNYNMLDLESPLISQFALFTICFFVLFVMYVRFFPLIRYTSPPTTPPSP